MPERFACEIVSLDDVYALSWVLAQTIRASDFEPDLVVAVARGGFIPARLLCDFLGLHDLASLQVRHYTAGARKQPTARVVAPLTREVAGRRVLVVDDVNDTGDTLVEVRRVLAEAGAREVRSAVLDEKEASSVRVDFRARTLERWHWIIYQWALLEDVTGFLDRMESPPRDVDEARTALLRDYALELGPADWKRIAAIRGW
jgi:hypoxanthine phosphoribosyltransferase